MGASITVADIFTILLSIAGIAVLVFLAMVLKNVFDITKKIKELTAANAPEFDAVIKQLPGIVSNVNLITHDATEMTKDLQDTLHQVKPEIVGLVGSVNKVSGTISSLADTVGETTEVVTMGIGQVADNVSGTVADITGHVRAKANRILGPSDRRLDVMKYVKEVFNVVRELNKK